MRNVLRTPFVAATLAAATLAIPAPVAAKAPSCDARGGKTLVANTSLRLYTKSVNGRSRLYGCRYKGSRNTHLVTVGKRREIALYGANGRWAFWVDQMSEKQRKVDETIRYSDVYVWDAVTRRSVTDARGGFVWTAGQIASNGRFAGTADPEARQLIDERTGEPATPVSGIYVLDPNGKPVPPAGSSSSPRLQLLATAPLGTISAFGITPDTVVWRQPDGLHTAPLAEPVV